MTEMTDEARDEFLRFGTRTAKLAVTRANGSPTVTPVWFVLDDDGLIRFNTGVNSPKARMIRRDPRVSLVVDLEEPPYAFVRVDGEAGFDDRPDEVYRVARAAGGRYMGDDRAEEFGRRNGGADETVVVVRPTKIVAMDGVSD